MSQLRFQFTQEGKHSGGGEYLLIPFTSVQAESIRSEYNSRYKSIIAEINEAGGFIKVIIDYKGSVQNIKFSGCPKKLLDKIAELDKTRQQREP